MKLRKIYFVALLIVSLSVCWITEMWSIWYILALLGCAVSGWGFAIDDIDWF